MTTRPTPGDPAAPERLPFFVYGTLRPGQVNHDRFLLGRTVAEEPGSMRGAVLYEGPGWPYAVEDPRGEIRGELVTPAAAHYDRLLAALDELEDFAPGDPANIYERVVREVLPTAGGAARAWVYLAAEPVARRLRTSGRQVRGGDWPYGSARYPD
ncbi:gamma-glutamylcyclotransferase family protein [Streptomyces sp. bgisy100]|uniref:gamma-glutamylcyclotransferase family protein n=1 Tax=Streptomyces sp. bgisy100 TaxID=3413783 RepID=UPI003D73749F